MLVLSISNHCCIRVVKQGLALLNDGVGVTFFHNRVANAEMKTILPSMSFWADRNQFVPKLQQYVGVDVIHVHNEPDWMIHVAKATRPDVPVVYDCHDLDSMRMGEASEDEQLAMRWADAFIFPSESYMRDATAFHKLPKGKPKAVIYSMCSEAMIVEQELPRLGGIVYEGGVLAIPPNAPAINWKRFGYRDYRPVSVALVEHGIPFVMYVASNKFMAEYLAAGAVWFGRLPYWELLRQMTRYDWGFVGVAEPHPQADKGMPNKLFDSIAAGIPVICMHHEEAARFVEKHRLGVVVDSVDDIPKVYGEHEKYRKIVREVRHDLTMESQMENLKQVYGNLLKGKAT